jgi:nickel-type superoxide dismutase maturation protease
MTGPFIRVKVAERSMLPALQPGDWLLVRRTRRIRPGHLVLARHPGRPDLLIVKRAARRAGDGWWLISDNPAAGAVDSRRFGVVPGGLIEGRVLFRYWRPRPGPASLSRLSRTALGLSPDRPAAVLAALTRRERGYVRAVGAPIRAEPPGAAGTGVDEHALAAGRLADAEPADADVGQPDGQAHHGPGGVPVRDRPALGVVHVPWLAVVTGQLGVHRVLHEQFVQPGRRACAVALRAGFEECPELVPELPECLEVGARDAVVEVFPVGYERAQSVERRKQVATLMSKAVGVYEPHREFGVRRQVHSRFLAAGKLV